MPPPSHAAKLMRLAAKQPAVWARELNAAGVPASTLSRMTALGQLRRLGRGLYASADASPSVHQSAIEVAKLAPKAVVSLLSAPEIHGIGCRPRL